MTDVLETIVIFSFNAQFTLTDYFTKVGSRFGYSSTIQVTRFTSFQMVSPRFLPPINAPLKQRNIL